MQNRYENGESANTVMGSPKPSNAQGDLRASDRLKGHRAASA
jgi:hypothetical protein